MVKLKTIEEFDGLKEKIKKSRDTSKLCVVVSSSTCGKASGSDKLIDKLKEEIKNQNLVDKVDTRVTGCLGFCQIEPIMIILMGLLVGFIAMSIILPIFKMSSVVGK